MIRLPPHAALICRQIEFLGRHAAFDGVESADALRAIIAELRSIADTLEVIATKHEQASRERTARNKAMYPEGQ